MFILLCLMLIIIEFCFYIYIYYILLPTLQPLQNGYKNIIEDPIILSDKFCNLIDSLESYNFDDFLSGWLLTKSYNKCDYKDVMASNVDSLFAWVVFNLHLNDLSESELKIIKNITNKFDGLKKEEGINLSLIHANYSLVPIKHIYHPLIIYIIFWCYVKLGHLMCLHNKGFVYCKTNYNMTYWYRKGSENISPLFIFHGINSLGWSLYSQLIEALGSNRTIILINYDAIKPCTLNIKVIDPYTLNKNIIDIIEKYKFNKISLFGHSWGTFIVGWIIKQIPEYILNITLIDPVALTINFPDTAYTMFYKPSKTITDYLLRYFLTYDITISYNIQRHFEWHNAVIYLEDIPDNIGLVIGVALKDNFLCSYVAVEIIDKFIIKRNNTKAAPIRKIVWDNFMHADSIMNLEAINNIAEIVNQIELL